MKTLKTTFAAFTLAALLTGTAATAQEDRDPLGAAESEALRAELAEVRADLAEAARRMAEIQRKLVAEPAFAELEALDSLEGVDIESIRIEKRQALKELSDMPPRLGVLLEGDEDATRVVGVTPGSGAARAGIRTGDVILSVNGIDVENRGGGAIREAMEGVEAGDTVEVVVRRGENGEEERAFGVETSSVGGDISFVFESLGDLSEISEHVRVLGIEGARAPRLPSPPLVPGFSALGADADLVRNHAGLQDYFGTGEGVIVLRIAQENPMGLEDGDVILTLDREPVDSPVDLARKLLRRNAGEPVSLEVMRAGVLTEVGGTIPERAVPFGLVDPVRIRIPDAPAAPKRPGEPPRRF